MKIYGTLNLLVFICLISNQITSQELEISSRDSIVKSSWIVGFGYNIVDDSGDAFKDITTIENQWNAVAFPSRLSIGRYFENGLGIEAIASYNRYKQGNIIDGSVNPEDKDYYGFDTRLSYDLNKIIGQTAWFDPYIGAGLGYTDANDVGRGTYNAVIGFRAWFSDRWGLDINSSGKWSFGNEATNHIQHAAGVVYQFGIEKGLSKKGQEKLAMIEALEKENQRVSDSINAAKTAEEESRILAERLAKEKENARLAAEEKAKVDAENQRRENIESAIKELGYVYFDLNSSYISTRYKDLLDQLVTLMKNNPTLEIRVSSHTDSRGDEAYNLWLSERRVKQTLDYIASEGIDVNRIQGEAFGEEQLTNDCKDTVPCSEKEHRANRRSEFLVIKI
ncbi:MAG: OmpA family protein [Saonia sp.]